MTIEQKERIAEINTEIANLYAEIDKINPYAKLVRMSNKEFGEQWSEAYIRSKVPNLNKNNGAGHDMASRKYPNVEVKSSRIVFDGSWTENQIHPAQADAYVFVWYNCDEGTEEICLISTKDMLDKCKLSKQHGDGCFSMRSTKHNREVLHQYMVPSFEDLNRMV